MRLLKPVHLRQARIAVPIVWPSYVGMATKIGVSTSGRVTVYVDASLGSPAEQNAKDLLAAADSVCAKNDAIFGTKGGAVNVIVFALGGVTDGTGGADHMACNYTSGQNIEVDVSYGDSERCIALFEAELSECSMGGGLCGYSTGEALSRWCAMWLGSNSLSDFATAPTWVVDGMPDYISIVDPTDQNPDSIGCGMVFLSWLQGPLAIPFSAIARAMVAHRSAPFSSLLATLTGVPATSAWPNFVTALQGIEIMSDDPFGALAAPQPAPPLPPTPPFVWMAPGWPLPSGDPHKQGQIWDYNGALRISKG